MKKILLWLIMGTRGGLNRGRIIKALHKRPFNANNLSESLKLNYRTVTHHLNILEENKVVTSVGEKYGKIYMLSDSMEKNYSEFDNIWIQLVED
ncbi:winged helix-turn-helix domain-containing protein [Methanobrevibacter sp. TMH8]|nr:winged helix-turn-helix domain-containing protein [Methanobrevibacter sp. TMH8]MBZ9570961.1 winged helix-turn-helix domain-containing protein [Methanobrevibacter sp. TMH8]